MKMKRFLTCLFVFTFCSTAVPEEEIAVTTSGKHDACYTAPLERGKESAQLTRGERDETLTRGKESTQLKKGEESCLLERGKTSDYLTPGQRDDELSRSYHNRFKSWKSCSTIRSWSRNKPACAR